jgi:DNA-binding response OmpR family regulator
MKVLWVENHESFAKLAAKQFLQDVELTVVPSIRAAKETISNGFDVALVDFDLDDGKGDELVRLLRAQEVRTMIVAASSHYEGNNALLAAGADTCCSKMKFGSIRHVLNSDGDDR